MFRLSKLLEKLEDKSEAKFKSWLARNKAKLPMRVPAVIIGWYFYGMFLNSLRLGISSTFHTGENEVKSIWVLDPFKNWGAVFTGFGIVTTLVLVLIICLITKKGYIWFSGYKYTHDPRGFDILPDGTHGTSGFLTESFNRFLIISLDVLICRYSPLFRAFPALFISEEPHKSFYYPLCFRSQK